MEWTLATLAVVFLAFAAISGRIEGTPITAPMFFTAAGLVVGVDALGLVDPSPNGETVKLLAEATLTLVLFADASRIDLRTLRGELAVPARLLGIGLPLTLGAGFLAALAVLGSLNWPEALVLAIILAPTDAALGQAVVTLPRLPSRIRQGLTVGLKIRISYESSPVCTGKVVSLRFASRAIFCITSEGHRSRTTQSGLPESGRSVKTSTRW